VRSPFSKAPGVQRIVVLLLLSLAGCRPESDRVLEETFEQLYPIQPNTDLSIQNGDGAILVYGSNINEIRVQATKKAYDRMQLKEMAIDVSVQPTSVSINVKIPPKPRWAFFDRSGTVDCTIVVPATTNISQLSLNAGEVLVDGMRGGSVHAKLGDGRMIVRNCFTDTDVALQRGNLTISYEWWERGTFSILANITHGNARAFLPSDAAFHLVAETAYGRITNDFDDPPVARPTSAEATKIDMLARGGGKGAIKMRTADGDIKIMEENP
jgi:putative adhesin